MERGKSVRPSSDRRDRCARSRARVCVTRLGRHGCDSDLANRRRLHRAVRNGRLQGAQLRDRSGPYFFPRRSVRCVLIGGGERGRVVAPGRRRFLFERRSRDHPHKDSGRTWFRDTGVTVSTRRRPPVRKPALESQGFAPARAFSVLPAEALDLGCRKALVQRDVADGFGERGHA